MNTKKRTYRGHEFEIYQAEGVNQTWWHWSTPDGASSHFDEGDFRFNGKNSEQAAIASAQTHINAMIAKGAYN